MTYRLAHESDLIELAHMRWDFRAEEEPAPGDLSRESFVAACVEFLRQSLCEGRWAYWLAEREGQIVAHVCVQRVAKIPKPSRLQDAWGYVTNVYTRPAYRGQGIGTALLERVKAWAAQEGLELLIVWPSEASVAFYQHAGFTAQNDIMECLLRPDEP
ncbi:MAG: GNAT family N-acetyltransferase [Chloroflexi bacterium]|nr:GNAT family N-acetyltransferase [Chloroflexota bacterium]